MGQDTTRIEGRRDLTTRMLAVRAESVNEKTRSVEAVISTEKRAEVLDMMRYEVIDEILRTDGLVPLDRAPLLDNHNRGSIDDILGIATAFASESDGSRSRRPLSARGDDEDEDEEEMDDDGDGRVVATLRFDDDERAERAFGKVKRSAITDVSVGYRVIDFIDIPAGKKATVGGRTYRASPDKPLRVTTKWSIREVSLTPIGADEHAKIRSSQEAPVKPEQMPDPAQAPEPAADDGERLKSILAVKGPRDIEERALVDGWNLDKYKAAVLDHERAKVAAPVTAAAPYGFASGRSENTPALKLRALTAGLAHQLGAQPDKFAETLNAERGKTKEWERAAEEGGKFTDLSYIQYMAAAVEAVTGKRAPMGDHSIMRQFFTLQRVAQHEAARAELYGERASPTVLDLQNLFTTNVNAMVVSAYSEAPNSAAPLAVVTDVPDFRSNERPRGTNLSYMSKLKADGEADHFTRDDTVESFSIARYANQLVHDERTIINDRLGAFREEPRLMGAAAARLFPDLFYYIYLYGSTAGLAAGALFSSGNGNLNTSTALTAANLITTLEAFESQTESVEGRTINLDMSDPYLVVPKALKYTALELVRSSMIVITGSTDAVRGSENVVRGSIRDVVSDARLDNGVTDPASGAAASGSATTWFLNADPVSAPSSVIEVAFRRGTGRQPVLRSGLLDQGQWGQWFDIKHDIGAKARDYRGIHKNTA